MSLLTSLMKHDILFRYITWLPNNTIKHSLGGESILLAKSKEYTFLYIPDKFQRV